MCWGGDIMNIKKIAKKNKLLIFALLSYIIAFTVNKDIGIKALSESKYYFIEMLEILPAVFVLVAIIQAWVPTKVVVKHFGDGAGIKGKVIAFAIGSLSAGPIYAAFPVCKMLYKKGASIDNIVIILSAWAVVKVPMLITEVKFMGSQYMIVRWIFTIVSIILMSYIMKLWVKEEDIPIIIEKGVKAEGE